MQLLTVSLRTGCGRRIATAKGTRASKTLGDVVEHSLAELGYVEGRNVMFVHRYSGPEVKRLGDLASELVRVGVDIIVTSTNPSTIAAMKATTTVPIVMTIGVEPVATRLVQSLTKPDGNVTGLTFDVDPEQLAVKRLANRALQRTGARIARPPATERERLDGVRVSESAQVPEHWRVYG